MPDEGVLAELAPGAVLAGLRVEAVAGRGGWSVVYRATELAFGRAVALKALAPELARSDEHRARFRRECEIAASLDHPAVLPVRGAGEHEGVPWVVVRWVEGASLRRLLDGGPLEPRRAAAIADRVAGALDAAHARGLVHRDVKPGNVLVEDPGGADRAYLTDFGLAKEISPDPGLTGAGRWLGTVDYAAPEQVRGEPADARSDVYALGATLFHALAGRVPYPGGDDAAKMRAQLHEPPPVLGDAALDAVIARAMAKDPAERFASAGELGRAAVSAGSSRPWPARLIDEAR
ncbi:MAG TPA: serine/threonine-protein kinase [Thermoleophilaceae bacterium]